MLVSVFWGYFALSRSVLNRWVNANDYELLHSEVRHFRRGPFFFTSSNGQTVYHVKLRTREGVERTGFVRCGSFWLGVVSDVAEARWDDE